MRTNIKRIQFAIRRRIALHGTPVTVTWTEFVGTPTEDPVTHEKNGETVTKSKTVRALIHFVGPATSGIRIHGEIQIGDAILDLDPTDVSLDGKLDLTFEFGDHKWVQKEIGQELAKSWDAMFADHKISRSILLRRKT